MKKFSFFLSFLILTYHCFSQTNSWEAGIHAGYTSFWGEGNNVFVSTGSTSMWKSSGYVFRAGLSYRVNTAWGFRTELGFQQFAFADCRPRVSSSSHELYTRLFPNEVLILDAVYHLNPNSIPFLNKNVDLSAFSGMGINYLNKNRINSPWGAMFRSGISLAYRINPFYKAELGADFNVASDNQNDYVAGKLPFDLFSTLTLGFIYQIPAHRSKKNIEVSQTVTIPKNKNVVKTEARAADIPKSPDTIPAQPDSISLNNFEQIRQMLPAESLFECIEFDSCSNALTNVNLRKIELACRYINKHPDVIVCIRGFSGVIERNGEQIQQGSKRNALAVAMNIIRDHAVSSRNIYVSWYANSDEALIKSSKNVVEIIDMFTLQNFKCIERR